MPAAFTAVHLDELPEVHSPEAGGVNWRPLRHFLGIGAFGINAFSANAGEPLSGRHDELPADDGDGLPQEEVYVVVTGAARFSIDDAEPFDARAGTVVFLPNPATVREVTATQDGSVLLAIGGTAGEAFRTSRWERVAVGEHGVPQHPNAAG